MVTNVSKFYNFFFYFKTIQLILQKYRRISLQTKYFKNKS